LTWTSNDTSITENELYYLVTYNLTEVVKEIYVRYTKRNEHGDLRTVVDIDHNSRSFKEQGHRYFGRCYTFNPKENGEQHGIYYIKASL
jgi:hypothetical protein